MEKTALLAALGAGDALPVDEIVDVAYSAPTTAQYLRAVDLLVGFGVVDDVDTLPTTDGPFERFTACGLTFSGPIGCTALADALDPTPPIEKLAAVEVCVDGITATISGKVAEGIAAAVRQAASSRSVASLAVVVDDNVVDIAGRRQGPGGDVA